MRKRVKSVALAVIDVAHYGTCPHDCVNGDYYHDPHQIAKFRRGWTYACAACFKCVYYVSAKRIKMVLFHARRT